jgi:hypothetical protein
MKISRIRDDTSIILDPQPWLEGNGFFLLKNPLMQLRSRSQTGYLPMVSGMVGWIGPWIANPPLLTLGPHRFAHLDPAQESSSRPT